MLSPLIFLLLFLPDRYRRTGSYSSGLSRPAHGGPETAPQPFRACAERRLSEVVFSQLLFFPGVHSGISLLFSPRSRGRFRIGLPGFHPFRPSAENSGRRIMDLNRESRNGSSLQGIPSLLGVALSRCSVNSSASFAYRRTRNSAFYDCVGSSYFGIILRALI